MYFTPFTEQELTKFLQITGNKLCTKDVHGLGASLQLSKEQFSSNVVEAKILLLNHLESAMRKLKSELPNEQHAKDVARLLMRACLYGSNMLPMHEKSILVNTGLVHAKLISSNLTIEFAYPKQDVLYIPLFKIQ